MVLRAYTYNKRVCVCGFDASSHFCVNFEIEFKHNFRDTEKSDAVHLRFAPSAAFPFGLEPHKCVSCASGGKCQTVTLCRLIICPDPLNDFSIGSLAPRIVWASGVRSHYILQNRPRRMLQMFKDDVRWPDGKWTESGGNMNKWHGPQPMGQKKNGIIRLPFPMWVFSHCSRAINANGTALLVSAVIYTPNRLLWAAQI